MPNIDLDVTLMNRKGQEFKEGGESIELGSTLLYALEHKQEKQPLKDSTDCYKLRKRLFNGGEVELDSEDITLLKKKCHDSLSQPAFFAVLDLIEA